jgi:glucose/mannose-6-phosphate isomerase
MYMIDKKNFKRYLLDFPKQILESQNIIDKKRPDLNYKKIENVIIFGMGGSAISGDVYRNIFNDRLTCPVEVFRNYNAPAYCGKNTLVIGCSYSGNTEETLGALDSVKSTECQIVSITSGGKLGKVSEDNGWPVIAIPDGYPPRTAFGFLFTCLLLLLNPILDKEVSRQEIGDLANMINGLNQRHDDDVAGGKLLARDLAFEIHHKIPVVYAAAPGFEAVARRWKNQFQENAKSMAFANVLPEMNHNEIVGYEMDHNVIDDLIVIFLENEDLHPRIATRLAITKSIISDRGAKIVEIYSEGRTPLEQAFSLICTGDWVSYYLALIYEKDPEAIVNIDYLKTELQRQQ